MTDLTILRKHVKTLTDGAKECERKLFEVDNIPADTLVNITKKLDDYVRTAQYLMAIEKQIKDKESKIVSLT